MNKSGTGKKKINGGLCRFKWTNLLAFNSFIFDESRE